MIPDIVNPLVPQPADLPKDNQPDFVANFTLINQFWSQDHVYMSGIITGATNTSPCVITSPLHHLNTGAVITILSVNVPNGNLQGSIVGMNQLNGNQYTVTVIDANRFSLNGVDATNFGLYQSGGFYTINSLAGGALYPYGLHNKLTFPNYAFTETSAPASPKQLRSVLSLYPKLFKDEWIEEAEKEENLINPNTQLFVETQINQQFFNALLTSTEITTTDNGTGIVTAEGIIINFGQLLFPANGINYTLPIPFSTTASAPLVGGAMTLIVTPVNSSTTKNYGAVFIDNTQFQCSSNDNLHFFYLAIGK